MVEVLSYFRLLLDDESLLELELEKAGNDIPDISGSFADDHDFILRPLGRMQTRVDCMSRARRLKVDRWCRWSKDKGDFCMGRPCPIQVDR